MKKVSIITRHAISNYGSLLQAFATQKIIESLGYQAEIIDYIREDENSRNIDKTLLKSKPKWNKIVLRWVYLACRIPETKLAARRFAKERRKYLNLTRLYSDVNDLKKEVLDTDIFMTGSDQVWGVVGDGVYDDAYFLSFANGKKIAYAASFGQSDFDKDLFEKLKYNLKEYESILVREDSAVDILQRMDLNAELVLDPTFLLSADLWNKYCERIKDENYILVYQIHKNMFLDKYARIISKMLGLKVIRISAYIHQITRGGKFVYCPSIGKFLSYIKNARYIITDSFHGTALAINFNKEFIEFLPSNNTETRNVSILKLTGLENRIVRGIDNMDVIESSIDYERVNKIINAERERSISLLKEALEH